MSSIRDKMIASIRGRSESPNPIYRGPRPESSSNASVASASSASIVSTSTSKGGPPPPPPPQAKQQLQQQQQQQQQQQSRPQARPKTPRNTTPSPMRRLPSSDALNRSSHNAIPTNDANDGSEQSKDRIIAQLKKSNTELTNKTAEMEVTFMNQCNVLAAEISDKNKLLQIQIDNNKELKLKVMSHESKLKEGIQIITALENEKQFQRSTITDLKNQLFQLQNDIEDSEYDKSNEVNLHKERTREAEQKTQQLEKEHSILLHKVDEVCMERDTVKAELVQTQMQLSLKEKEDQNNSIEIAIQGNNFVSGTPKFPNSPMNNSSYNTYNNNTNNNNANSSSSMNSNNSNYNNNGNNNISSSASVCSETTEVRQNWRQLEEKKEQLDKTLSLLHETQSALATLDHKHKALTKQFDDKLDNATTEIKTNLSKQIDELSSSLRARDDTIANLHERLETYNEDLTKAEDEVDRLNAEIDKARVSSLMEELEEAQKLLEQEKQLTAELTEKYDDLNDTVEQLEEETHQLRINSVDQIIEKKDKHITSLENEVTVFRNKLGEEKQQAEMLLNIKVSRINQLEDELKKVSTTPEMRLEQLEEENENLQHDLELMEKELNDAIEAHNQMENDMQRQLDQQNEDLLLSHSDESNDLVRKFDMSTNSIGLVNDMVVTRLKSNLTDMEEDHLIVMKELEEQIATKDDKIVELQDRIVKLQDEIGKQQKEASSIKSSHKDEISKLKTAIKETKNSVESIQTLVEEKEAEIKRLTNFANLEATAKEIQLAECTRLKKSEERNSTLLKEKEKEIKGLENDVAKLKANAERTQKDADGKNNQFLEDKENEIKRLKDDLTKQKASAEQIQKDLDEKHNQDLEEKENEIQSSRNDFAKYKASAEQKQLDMRQDVESREESWKVEKRQILEERKDHENKLNEALKESRDQFDYIEDLESREESWKAEKEQLIEEHEAFSLRLEKESSSQKENVQEMEELQKAWKGAKKQLMEEKEDYIKRLEDTLEESASLKEQIAELESKSLSQEEKLSSYKDDLLLLDELQNDFAQQQMELDTMKDLMSSEKKNHEKIIAGYKQTEGKKRGDKLKVIELSEEVDKLRLELRKLKGKENDISDKTRQEAVKRAYGVAKDTKHKKEISELEETWKREINELKRKLSDRDTAMAATLRSSVLQDQRISNLKENLRQLQDKYNIGSDTFSVSSGHGAFEELENLRESVHTHEENQKSLSQQIKLLKKQLADARIKMSKNRNGSNTRQLEEYKTKVRERDGAIQTLVKSSITQEQQIAALRDEITDLKDTKSRRPESKNAGAPSWSEIERLQQESEIFAGQIIEQDEELEDLRRALKESLEDAKQNESLHEMVDDLREQLEEQHNMRDKEKISKRTMSDAIKMELEEERWRRNEDDRKNKTLSDAMNMELDEERRIREKERERNRTTSDAMKMELEEERKKRERLENELENIQSKVGRSDKQDMRLTKIHDELEEVEEANQKLQYEMRDLRRKLRGARLEAERVNELESELSETRKTLSEMKKLKHQSGGSNEHHSREELDEIIEQRDALDSENQKMQKRLQNMEEECKKIEEAHHNLEEALGICREEKDKLYDEFAAKMLEMKKIEEALRQELTSAETNRNEIEVKTEQKIKKLEENESILKSQIESQKALREIAVNDKDISKTQALQEVAMYQARMIEFQKNNDDQNDLIASLTAEVKNLRNTQMQRADTESTEIIAALSDEVKKLRQENMSKKNDGESSEIIIALTEEVKKLRNAQSNNDSDDVIAALTQEVKTVRATLNKERQGQNSAGEIERVIRSEIDLEMQSIRNQKDFLGKENMKLQTKLDALGGSDSKKTAALKKQVEEAEKGRTLFEKTMISTYERKLNLMQMNKDLTIDGLRKDLTQSKETLKEVESDLLDNIKQLETEKNELEMELKAKMQHKNAKIQFLEQTLSAHEQVASHMKDELDQLQNGMETVSVTRRAELEEMQEELMNVQSRATRYEREITALKMKIEDQRAHHKNEMSRLQYHMEEMEMENDEAPSIRQLAEKDKMALHSMSKQVDSLRTKVSSLQEENFDLREKIEKKGDARSSKNDKWRNSALQEQVQALTRRLREVEDDDASIRSSSSRRSMRSGPGTQRRIPPTPRGTGLSNRRTGFGSVTDDISTHTEETF